MQAVDFPVQFTHLVVLGFLSWLVMIGAALAGLDWLFYGGFSAVQVSMMVARECY